MELSATIVQRQVAFSIVVLQWLGRNGEQAYDSDRFFTFGKVEGDARCGRSRHRPAKVFELVKFNLATLKVAKKNLQDFFCKKVNTFEMVFELVNGYNCNYFRWNGIGFA